MVLYVKAPSITYITLETKYHQPWKPWKPNSTVKPRLSLCFTDLDNRLPCHTSSSWARRCPSCGMGNRRTPRHPRSTARSTSYCDLPTNIPHFELSGLLTIVSMYEISWIFLLPRISAFDKGILFYARYLFCTIYCIHLNLFSHGLTCYGHVFKYLLQIVAIDGLVFEVQTVYVYYGLYCCFYNIWYKLTKTNLFRK